MPVGLYKDPSGLSTVPGEASPAQRKLVEIIPQSALVAQSAFAAEMKHHPRTEYIEPLIGICDFVSEHFGTKSRKCRIMMRNNSRKSPVNKYLIEKIVAKVREGTLFSGLLPCRPKGVSACSVVKGHLHPAPLPSSFYHGKHGNRLRRTRKEVGKVSFRFLNHDSVTIR